MLNALLVFVFTSSLSFASTQDIHLGTLDRPILTYFDYIEADYTFNGDTVGVNVSFMERGDCGDSMCHADTPIYTFQKTIHGLSLQNDQLIFEQDGQQVVCGQIRATRVFNRRKLFSNGNCGIDVRSRWENRKRIHEVFFITI